MRKAVLGFLLGAVLVAALAGWLIPGNSVLAQHARAGSPPPMGDLVTLHWPVQDGKQQQLVVIDPRLQAMSVYHVDAGKGTIQLMSVRQLQPDLQLRGFNEVRPYADEIRAMAESRPPEPRGMPNQR
jgi:hypothetical protein